MHSNTELLPMLNMREHSSWPRLHSGNSSSRSFMPHRRAISPSAAGEPAGIFATHSRSPIGLSVLFGGQRITAQHQSATRHHQVGRLPCGSRRTKQAARTNLQHLANSLEITQGAALQTPSTASGTACEFSHALPSRTCLTNWSRGRPVPASRFGNAKRGAPYLGR